LHEVLCIVIESHDEETEGREKAQQKVGKPAEMIYEYMPQGEAEDLKDELAQIKGEIKKLMHEVGEHYIKWLSIYKQYLPIKGCMILEFFIFITSSDIKGGTLTEGV
jgi:desulfoferrodoxin (superoxide reductase-like protein)